MAAVPVERGIGRARQQRGDGLQVVLPVGHQGGRHVLRTQPRQHGSGIGSGFVEALAQHAVGQHQRLARGAFHRHAAFVQGLGGRTEVECAHRTVAALHRELLQREHGAQRGGRQQAGNQQKGGHQQLAEGNALKHGRTLPAGYCARFKRSVQALHGAARRRAGSVARLR
jgi:hypothetical protein